MYSLVDWVVLPLVHEGDALDADVLEVLALLRRPPRRGRRPAILEAVLVALALHVADPDRTAAGVEGRVGVDDGATLATTIVNLCDSRNLFHKRSDLQSEHAADDGALLLAEVVVADGAPDAPEAHLDAAGSGPVAAGQSHRHRRRAQPRVLLV